jgi:hypothetical protein
MGFVPAADVRRAQGVLLYLPNKFVCEERSCEFGHERES